MTHLLKFFLFFLLAISSLYGIEVKADVDKEQSKLEHISKSKPYFGEQLFQGHFTNKSQFRENPDYILRIGDIIHIDIWGAREFQGDVTIDGRGNIFIPKIDL